MHIVRKGNTPFQDNPCEMARCVATGGGGGVSERDGASSQAPPPPPLGGPLFPTSAESLYLGKEAVSGECLLSLSILLFTWLGLVS